MKKPGFGLRNLQHLYYTLLDKGVKITVASPKGGKAPIDPRSKAEGSQTEATSRFNNDKTAQEIICLAGALNNLRTSLCDSTTGSLRSLRMVGSLITRSSKS